MGKAEEVVEAYLARFPDCGSQRPRIDSIEELMRPFAPITYETQRKIDHLFNERDLSSTLVGQHAWWEADFVVSGDGPHHDHTIDFLIRDTCSCVTPHLPAALQNARREVDPRIIQLMRDLGQLPTEQT